MRAGATPVSASGALGSVMVAALVGSERVISRLIDALGIFAFTCTAALSFYQIVARFILEQPAAWSEPLTRMAMIWAVFLGLYALFRKGALISMDFAERRAAGATKQWMLALHTAAALAVMSFALYGGIKLLLIVRTHTISGLAISVGYAYAAVPVGAGLAIIAILATAMTRLASYKEL